MSATEPLPKLYPDTDAADQLLRKLDELIALTRAAGRRAIRRTRRDQQPPAPQDGQSVAVPPRMTQAIDTSSDEALRKDGAA